MLENTVARELLYDFLAFMQLAVFGNHGATEVTAVERSVRLTALCLFRKKLRAD